jgi:hypothetical protein
MGDKWWVISNDVNGVGQLHGVLVLVHCILLGLLIKMRLIWLVSSICHCL